MKATQVKIIEVGPRDGIQNEAAFLPTDVKVAFIDMLSAAGYREIEATSFVSPDKIPQLADATEVMGAIKRAPGTTYACMVPNMRGMKRAVELRADKVVLFTAASETFNQKNVNASIDESLGRFREIVGLCRDSNITPRGSISCCFECPYEGAVAPGQVERVVDAFFAMGITEITLADTVGVIAPPEMERLVAHLAKRYDLSAFSMHLHNTKGCAIASVWKAWEMGITCFESSAGGLGGCPYAPGASGNLPTEEVVYLFHRMGVSTGIDLDKLCAASVFIERHMGRPLTSRVLCAYKAGLTR